MADQLAVQKLVVCGAMDYILVDEWLPLAEGVGDFKHPDLLW